MRIVWADKGRRTLKYHQLLSEVLELSDAEKALVTVLLLRGAQAPGELRTRTDRLHGFADREAVEVVLADLAARPEPLVRELPRQRGQHDSRWVHLLGDVPLGDAVVAEPASHGRPRGGARRTARRPATSECGRPTTRSRRRTPTTSSTSCSGSSRSRRWLLDRVAAHADGGPVVEVGCGPGHVTAYLADAGADASRRRPVAGDGRGGAAPVPGRGLPGRRPAPADPADVGARLVGGPRVVLAHPPRGLRAPRRARRTARPLVPGGWLVVGAARRLRGPAQRRAGSTCRSTSTSSCTTRARWCAQVEAAGLTDIEWYHRGPITARGETTQRLYVVGRKPAACHAQVLFSSTSGHGHVIPMLPLARAFREAGHDVLWATAAQATSLVTAAGIEAVASGASGAEEAALRRRGAGLMPSPWGLPSGRRSCSPGCSVRR